MNKYIELKKISNPDIVFKHAMDLGYKIDISSRKDKKYMILRPDGKLVHFGQMGYMDWTKHQDEKRRMNFLKRNWRWASANKYSPAYLSYYLLW
jgi:hypothetical protein